MRIRLQEKSTILESGSISATTSSSVVDLRDLEGLSIQTTWSSGSSLTGSISLFVSVDGVNYSEDPDSIQAVASNSGSHIYNVHDFHYPFLKCTFTRTAGSATFEMTANTRARI